ncbi:MAG: amidase [Chloroflexota bacterium]
MPVLPGEDAMSREPYELGVAELAPLIAKKELSPVALVKSCLGRIKALDEKIEAWALVDEECALERAKELEKELSPGKPRSPLHGIPIGIKDIFYTAGIVTEAGSLSLKGFVPTYDATVVIRLQEAGAVVLGKTQTTEFAYLDPAKTHNPWNLSHTPGGSSSGSAAAVASRMCPLALGSQTGGSTLRPAAFNGIVGFKAEYGRISTYGVVPLSFSMDHVGILARTVRDIALTFQVIAGFDVNDSHSLNLPVPDAQSRLEREKPPRLGLIREYFYDNADAGTRRETDSAVSRLQKAGAILNEVKLPPGFAETSDLNQLIMSVEAATYHEVMFSQRKNQYRPKISSLIEEGLAVPAVRYARALESRLRHRANIAPLFSEVDALVTPGAPGIAPKDLTTTGSAVMQRPWSLTGLPSVSLPIGLGEAGLPLAIQLVGAPFGEAGLLSIARWCERSLNVELKPLLN